MKVFKINDYLSLKLKGQSTIIYVKDKPFNQCNFLLLDIPIKEITSLDDIQTIDEISKDLDRSLEPKFHRVNLISPEDEFWGHCSNLQVWAENNYNTRLLHRSIAFPLLKKLIEAGDPIANKVFKKEIANRINSGESTVIRFLVLEGYLEYFNNEEIKRLLGDYEYVEYKGKKVMVIHGVLDLSNKGIKDLSEIKGLDRLKYLKILNLHFNKLRELPEWIGNFTSLEELNLGWNRLSIIPDSIGNLESLIILNLTTNKLITIPESIRNLTSLDILIINVNKLTKISESICNLKTLHYLFLDGNKIKEVPECIGNLTLLDELFLNNNHISNLPNSIGNLKLLTGLHLRDNKLFNLPESIKNLVNLEIIDIKGNNLRNLHNSILNLKSLKELHLNKSLYKKSHNLVKMLEEKGTKIY